MLRKDRIAEAARQEMLGGDEDSLRAVTTTEDSGQPNMCDASKQIQKHRKISETDDQFSESKTPLKYLTMPFHHLISAKFLSPDASGRSQHSFLQFSNSAADRQQRFWQTLAERGVPANEAALFNSVIGHTSLEFDGENLTQTDWEVLHFDALEGRAELYLAEMFLCKKRIYEAETEIASEMEFFGDEIAHYLPAAIFTADLIDNIILLFANSLMASYDLTVSRAELGSNKSHFSGTKKKNDSAYLFRSHNTVCAGRVSGWHYERSDIEHNQADVYIAGLSSYWTDWRQAARAARFDFNLLASLTEERLVRFYELTKLLRAINVKSSDDDFPRRLEIRYEHFARLMPLPLLTDEREVKKQINELVKPLKQNGYIKSFALKSDWRGVSVRDARLSLQFND